MAITAKDLSEAQVKLAFYKEKWQLVDDGEPIVTRSSYLIPVLHNQTPAMLKIPMVAEERAGIPLMAWWDGEGAAKVINFDRDALLMQRATGQSSLIKLVKDGKDDEASRVICDVVAKLHASRKQAPPKLIPLPAWFKDLMTTANQYGGIFAECAGMANSLLNNQEGITVLHGDIHHGNILDFSRGWLAVDPKGLVGERTFDFANIFCNPDLNIAASPGRLARQLEIVAAEGSLEPKRLLQWIVAWAGLSASWMLSDGESPDATLSVAEVALSELRKH